jgi:hypothetical protein
MLSHTRDRDWLERQCGQSLAFEHQRKSEVRGRVLDHTKHRLYDVEEGCDGVGMGPEVHLLPYSESSVSSIYHRQFLVHLYLHPRPFPDATPLPAHPRKRSALRVARPRRRRPCLTAMKPRHPSLNTFPTWTSRPLLYHWHLSLHFRVDLLWNAALNEQAS